MSAELPTGDPTSFKFNKMASDLYEQYFGSSKSSNNNLNNNQYYIGDPPDWLQNNPFTLPQGIPSTGLPPYTSPNTAPPIQWPSLPQMMPHTGSQGNPGHPGTPGYRAADLDKLIKRVAELELKVYTLMTILHYITGVKNGTQPEDNIQNEEKPAQGNA